MSNSSGAPAPARFIYGLIGASLLALIVLIAARGPQAISATDRDIARSPSGMRNDTPQVVAPLSADSKPIIAKAAARTSRISTENALPGTDEWADVGNYDIDHLSSYPGATSVDAGGQISFYVKGSGTTLTARLYRLGYYQNHGARLITTFSSISLAAQPNCTRDSATGLVRCPWNKTFSITTNASWISGIYLLRIDSGDGYRFFNHFVVRNDSYASDIVVQLADKTNEAYNFYGGESLYVSTNNEGRVRGYQVSFDRPYRGGAGTGALFTYDFDMLRWMEASGYDVSYISDVDNATNGAILNGHKVVLTMGHPEYWTWAERDHMDAAVANGTNMIFASANESFWNVRLESSPVGANRIITCYKDENLDPIKTAPDVTVEFHNPILNRPENKLVGVGYQSYQDDASYRGAWRQAGSLDRWYYDCTNFQPGDVINNIVGDEWDARRNNGMTPAGLETLTDGVVWSDRGDPYIHEAAIYTATSGAKVFAAASIHIAWGLIDHSYSNQVFQSYVLSNDADHRLEQLFANVIDNFAGYWNGSPRACANQNYYDIGARATRTALPEPPHSVTPTNTPPPNTQPTNTPTNTPTPTVGAQTCANVNWASPENVAISGNTITKTGTTFAYDAGAVSSQVINGGNGYVEATVDSIDTFRMFGLSNGNIGVGFEEIKFAAFLAGDTFKIFESGDLKGSFGALAVGDVIRVSVENNHVKYYHNGTLAYTSSAVVNYPLIVDGSISDPGGKIANVVICIGGDAGPTDTPAPATATSTPTNTATPSVTATPRGGATCSNVTWTTLVNVTASGNTITKTGTGFAYDAGAVSSQSITAGDGYVEAVVDSIDTYRMFGLTNNNTGATIDDIRFAAYLAADSFKVFENGDLVNSFGALAVGDVIRVGVVGGQVKYYRNGTVLYTSTLSVSYPLIMDSTISDPGGKISDAVICSGSASGPTNTPTSSATVTNTPTNSATATKTNTPIPGATNTLTASVTATATRTNTPPATNTATATASATATATATKTNTPSGPASATPTTTNATCAAVVWTSPINVSVSGNTITKNGGVAYAWDAGAVASQSITSGDGYVEATVDSLDPYRMFGLSNSSAGGGYEEIKFAAYLAGDTLKVFESGDLVASFGPLAVGDVVRVAVLGGQIKYYRNGSLVFTSAGAVSYPLIVDSSIADPGGKISNAMLCTGSAASTGTPTNTPTSSATATATNTPINTATKTPTATATNTATKTPPPGATATRTSNVTMTRTRTATVTSTATRTRTATRTATRTSTATATRSATRTATPVTGAVCANVTWTAKVNTSSAGNTLTKTSPYLLFNAGAVSSQAIQSGDGEAHVTVTSTRDWYFFGLSYGNTNSSYEDIDYAIYVSGDNTLEVRERGIKKLSIRGYALNDLLRVTVENGVVKYYRNNTRLYTSTVRPTYPLLLDSSLLDYGAKIARAQICGSDLRQSALATILVDPLPMAGTPVPLNDVHSTDYFNVPVQYLARNGIISGYADHTFRPYANTTRGQLAKIIVLAENWPLLNPGQARFGDVSRANTFYSFIETAFAKGVISGYADGTFKPYNSVTRGQLSKIIVLAQAWPVATGGTAHFSDVPRGSTFYGYVETAYAKGIISGYADGTFGVGTYAIRAQIAKIVYNSLLSAP